MRYIFTILTLLCAIVLTQAQTRRVLFIGNSYTFVNNLPQLIADAAISADDTLIFDSHAVGGYTLDEHFADTISTNKIKEGGWDYVILQDQSQIPALPDYSPAAAVQLSLLTKEYNNCARPLFYMTWGRENGDDLNCPTWPPVCTYEGMDSLLHLSYVEMAMINHAEVSPVGAVWRYIRENYPDIILYQPDGSHPTPAGSYVAACCFYASIFKKDPTLISYNYVLDATDAAVIRNAAKMIVFDSLANWFFEGDLPVADFYYTIGAGTNEVHLYNNSLNASTCLWNFGDGDSSTDASPTHSYLADGSYTISLTALSCDLSVTHESTYQTNIGFCAFAPVVFPDSIMICPNRNDTLWTQVYDSYQWYDTNGDPLDGETNQYLTPSNGGFYSLLATKDGCSEMSAQVIVNAYHPSQSFNVSIEGSIIEPDTVCLGDTVQLLLTPNKPPFPNDKDIQWFKDGLPIPSSHNDSLIVSSAGNYQVTLVDSTYCPGNIVYASLPMYLNFVDCSLPIHDIKMPAVLVYPNPSEDFIIKIDSELIGTDYLVNDLLGRIIQTGIFDKEINNLRMNNLANGIYILKIEGQNDQVIKLIRQ